MSQWYCKNNKLLTIKWLKNTTPNERHTWIFSNQEKVGKLGEREFERFLKSHSENKQKKTVKNSKSIHFFKKT